MSPMTRVAAAWSEQAQKVLGVDLPGAMEALVHHPTVREILKIHGPQTRIWVQSAGPVHGGWTASGAYETPDGDSIHFKVSISRAP